MKIILLEDVKSLGKKGEIVKYEGKTFDPKDYIGADKACLLYTSDAADD